MNCVMEASVSPPSSCRAFTGRCPDMWAKTNLASGLVFLALGALVLGVLIPYGIEKPASLQFRALSPSFWPNTVGTVVTLIGLALIASSFARGGGRTRRPQSSEDRQQPLTWLTVRPFVVMAICFKYVLFPLPLIPDTTVNGLSSETYVSFGT